MKPKHNKYEIYIKKSSTKDSNNYISHESCIAQTKIQIKQLSKNKQLCTSLLDQYQGVLTEKLTADQQLQKVRVKTKIILTSTILQTSHLRHLHCNIQGNSSRAQLHMEIAQFFLKKQMALIMRKETNI